MNFKSCVFIWTLFILKCNMISIYTIYANLLIFNKGKMHAYRYLKCIHLDMKSMNYFKHIKKIIKNNNITEQN